MNLGQKALQVLKTVAPVLGTAIGGPFGTLAGAAVSAAIGTPVGDDKAAETALLSASPEALLALKKAEQDFQVQMKTLGISEEKLAYDDIANARSREVSVKDCTPAVLALFVTVGFFASLGYMMVVGKPKEGGDVMLTMLGTLGTAWVGIITYYFGSSVGSKTKDDALSAIATQK